MMTIPRTPPRAAPTPFTLPAPVGEPHSAPARVPGSLLLVTALNLAWRASCPRRGPHAAGKRLRIQVRDARVAFDFTWTGAALRPRARASPATEADLCISASAHDFLLLAQRQQDPDTLFFSRRLVMEGDTELGLVVKNTLDALELPVLDPQQWTPARCSRRAGALRQGAGHTMNTDPALSRPAMSTAPPTPAPGLFLLGLLQRRAAGQPCRPALWTARRGRDVVHRRCGR
jgi:predicted lipid carrier protein YhbT